MTTRMITTPLRALPLVAPVLLWCACTPDATVDRVLGVDYGDRFVEIETRGHYSALDALQLLQLADLGAETETTTGFHLFQVRYETTGLDGDRALVSGLMAVPDSESAKGIVSWQHGTNATRSGAPSSPGSMEGILLSAVFAGNENILLAPDYIGLGASREVPPYMHVESTVDAVVDLLAVGSSVLQEFEGDSEVDLALVGFSQGGAATAAVQRRLQEDNPTGLELRCAAALAGPYNLRDVAINYAIEGDKTYYLAYVANAYAHVYDQPLSSIIREEYLEVLPGLFDGGTSNDDIMSNLPDTVQELYVAEMIDDIVAGRDNWFTLALEENETYRWVPETELRLYYGERDRDVSPDDAEGAFNYYASQGGNARLVNVGRYGHSKTALIGVPHAQDWFNSKLEDSP